MSRTRKDRPAWVQQFDPTLGAHVVHDHRHGECRVETLEEARAYAGGAGRSYRHYKNCKKREVVLEFCTKQDPYREHRRGYLFDRRVSSCWTYWFDFENHRHVWNRCEGHRKVVIHDEIPCSCDQPTPPPSTCDVRPGYEHSHYFRWQSGVPKWYIDGHWNNPERVRVRDELGRAKALYNGGDFEDEEFDFDFDNPQHRRRAGWHYY